MKVRLRPVYHSSQEEQRGHWIHKHWDTKDSKEEYLWGGIEDEITNWEVNQTKLVFTNDSKQIRDTSNM